MTRCSVWAASRVALPCVFISVLWHMQGSAFYTVQSCLNHDSDPNCSCQKDIEDRDGAAVLTTTRAIHVNEELTISYVGHISNCDSPHTQATLREYGIHVR